MVLFSKKILYLPIELTIFIIKPDLGFGKKNHTDVVMVTNVYSSNIMLLLLVKYFCICLSRNNKRPGSGSMNAYR